MKKILCLVNLYRAMICLGLVMLAASGYAQDNTKLSLEDLSEFVDPSPSWQPAGQVTASLEEDNTLKAERGTGILVNDPKNHQGKDLYTNFEHGDMDLELEYMMAKGSNSGIYLQGRYELQLRDSWGVQNPTSGDNGGIYERWDEARPEGRRGFQGHPPRQNASRAPGLWQHLSISFRAPRFDPSGQKTENARILRIELNGVTIHQDVELTGPTRGAIGEGEVAQGPLRFQGDHGAVAFRNIRLTRYDQSEDQFSQPATTEADRQNVVHPIYVSARTQPLLRSFRDLPGGTRLTHAVSVSSPENVHYTYDLNHGNLVQVWRGKFLDATPMWHRRGDGSSRPAGSVENLLQSPSPVLNKLQSRQSDWTSDTTGSGFRPLGYELIAENVPVFKYRMYGTDVCDKVQATDDGTGVERTLELADIPKGLFLRLATGRSIEQLRENLFLVDDQSYYLRIDDPGGNNPFIRTRDDHQELLVPAQSYLRYTVLF